MFRPKRLVATAATLLVFTSVLQAQVELPKKQRGEISTPGWNEFQDLSVRLEAVEAENRWLRDEIDRFNHGDESVINQVGYCSFCGETACGCNQVDDNCGWISQISATCKTKLSRDKGPIRVVPFGYAAADMIASESAFALLGGPLFLLPAVPAGIPDDRFTISGQQTTLGFNVMGPDLGTYLSGATIAFNFFGDRPVQNNPGAFFILGYVELKNEDWRFWAGQDGDAIARQNSNSPAWTSHKQSGNVGQIRPGFRAERFFAISEEAQTSVYFGLTQQVALDFIANSQVAGTDNGWPNVEARWEIGLGPDDNGQRPVMVAIGGLIGETRAVDFTGRPVANVSTTWGVMPELRVQYGCVGFQGELFVGEALGTYNAGIGQSLNALTDEPIYTAGGFGELFCNVTEVFTVAIGYGIDDPRDADLALTQRSRNETYWANAICRWSEQWETRCEVSRLKTDYINPGSDSKSMIYQLSVRYNF